MKKFYVTFILLIGLLVSLANSPIEAFAETVSGKDGENVTWTYDDDTQILTLSGTGDMYEYEGINGVLDGNGLKWPEWQDDPNIIANIVEINIEDGITSIGAEEFALLNGVPKTITIPKSVVKTVPMYFQIMAESLEPGLALKLTSTTLGLKKNGWPS